MKGIPISWLLQREVTLEVGDTFHSRLDGVFKATAMTLDFIKVGFYQEDLTLVAFKCAREGEFDLMYEMWESTSGLN
jgi:hypothetical protein